MANIEFRPVLKNYKVANGKVIIQLEVSSDQIAKDLGELAMLEGGPITALFQPETITYQIKYNKDDDKPAERYGINEQGEWDKFIEEQTNLIDTEEFENREFKVEVAVVDEFIKHAELGWAGKIDLIPVLEDLEKGRSYENIGEDYGLSEDEVKEELDEARNMYAPYAAAWDEMRNKED